MVTFRSLGVLPIIAQMGISIVSWMVRSRLSAYEAAKRAAAEYDIFQTLTEAQISELAFDLGRKTDYPEWQWFNILRWAQEYGLIDPVPEPIPEEEDEEEKTPIWMWAAAGGFVLLLLSIR